MSLTPYTLERVPYKAAAEREFIALYKGAQRPNRAVMFIHGHRSSGWESLERWGLPLADAGFLAILPTLVGYAHIPDETSDFDGPRTIADLMAVIKQARNEFDIYALGVWGISRGAIAASLLAVDHPDWFEAVVLQSGSYDFKAHYAETLPEIKAKIEEEVVPLDDSAFRARSSFDRLGQVKKPMLILQGIQDDRTTPGQIYRLRDALAGQADIKVELIEAGHFKPAAGQTPAPSRAKSPHPKLRSTSYRC